VRGAGLLNIAEVGTYALRFDWSDGHSTGIYTWEYLQEIGKEMVA
jgi:ATP-binding protein involved in chromosome partitioning